MSADTIEKEITLRAPLARVWKAITDTSEFGTWFGVDFEGQPFVAGETLIGKTMPTKVDPEIAKMQEPFRGKRFEIRVDRIEPQQHFSFFWHPFAKDRGVDYTKEEPTLVVFRLEAVDVGTKLVVTESGFDKLPEARRAEAFHANDAGWAHQTKLVEKYLVSHA